MANDEWAKNRTSAEWRMANGEWQKRGRFFDEWSLANEWPNLNGQSYLVAEDVSSARDDCLCMFERGMSVPDIPFGPVALSIFIMPVSGTTCCKAVSVWDQAPFTAWSLSSLWPGTQ